MQCIPSRQMTAHVLGHANVHHLSRQIDGTYHLIFALTPRTQDPWVVCVGETTVVIHNQTARRVVLDTNIHLALRAYYPGEHAPPVRATVRQLLVSHCNQVDQYVEEHRVGVVPPMIASRESVVVNGVPSMLATRVMLTEPMAFVDLSTTMTVADGRPGKTVGLHERAKRAGLRDLPPTDPPLLHAMDTLTPASLLHLIFRIDTSQRIGSLFES